MKELSSEMLFLSPETNWFQDLDDITLAEDLFPPILLKT